MIVGLNPSSPALDLIDAGGFDFKSGVPMYDEIQSLVDWGNGSGLR